MTKRLAILTAATTAPLRYRRRENVRTAVCVVCPFRTEAPCFLTTHTKSPSPPSSPPVFRMFFFCFFPSFVPTSFPLPAASVSSPRFMLLCLSPHASSPLEPVATFLFVGELFGIAERSWVSPRLLWPCEGAGAALRVVSSTNSSSSSSSSSLAAVFARSASMSSYPPTNTRGGGGPSTHQLTG